MGRVWRPTAEQAKRIEAAMPDAEWAAKRIAAAGLFGCVADPVFKAWKKRYGDGSNAQRYRANSWLREFLSRGLVGRLPVSVGLRSGADSVLVDDGDIDRAARSLANAALHSGWPFREDVGFSWLCSAYMVNLPKLRKDGTNVESARLRAIDRDYWKRQIRRVHGLAFESVAIASGHVCNRASLYVSEWTFRRVISRRRRNADILSRTVATNQYGQSFTLQELSDKSVSNPVIKRAEMMVRARGVEEYSKEQGHIGLFLTLTAPSRMHPIHSKSGRENERFDGMTPREVHDYLNRVWSRTRAQWARDGVTVYGVRTVEPHHDGTPHWHLLLFVDPAKRHSLLRTFRRYALADSPDEKGAWRRRFTWKDVDPNKGTAVGYLAKYICKNIDGFKADGHAYDDFDHEGGDTLARISESAVRVGSWASQHCIRQFQFIGTTSVTVWRELRRLKAEDVHEELRAFVAAADASDWGQYLRLCGGPVVPRIELPVAVYRKERENRYKETVKVVSGVTFTETAEVTVSRFLVWTISSGATTGEASAASKPVDAVPWTRVTNCTASDSIGIDLIEVPDFHPSPSLPPLSVPAGRLHPDWLGMLMGELQGEGIVSDESPLPWGVESSLTTRRENSNAIDH